MSSDEEIFEVDEILDERKRGNTTQYLVRWKGFGPSEDSWEPRKNLGNCTEALEVYYKKHATPKPPASPGRSTRSTRSSMKKAVVPKSSAKETRISAAETKSITKSAVSEQSAQKSVTLTRSALRQVYTASETTTPGLSRTPLRTRAKLDFEEAKDAISNRLRQGATTSTRSTTVTTRGSTSTTSGSTRSRAVGKKYLRVTAADIPLIILVAILLFIWISLMYQFFYAAKKK
ncbi:chromodomain Y-like protein [Lingula anatina]|uniref:Chromodomain Y-like protein n=1 Tax=Lingula anatina TaxID=7574 RepID=A0A1S3K8B7_LINAN|nr:chromodomain Y-like protein [Lingula anatina]|eukprot:XP_013418501.1 chromodomain Y-like protein [Lingula anatina]